MWHSFWNIGLIMFHLHSLKEPPPKRMWMKWDIKVVWRKESRTSNLSYSLPWTLTQLTCKDTTKNCKLLSDTMDTAKEIVSLIKFSPKRENLLGEIESRSETVVASLRWVWFVSCITTESAAENQFCQALIVHYILIGIHVAWIKVLLLAFCYFDKETSEDQLSFKGVSCDTSHFGICCSQIQRCSFY